MKTWDVIIAGGGIIGLSLSLELRKRGATVLVVERGEPGREASSAAGGMLVDSDLETQPALQDLASSSARLYPDFVSEIEAASGMKVDLRDQGTILYPSAGRIPRSEPGRSPLTEAELVRFEPELAKTATEPAFYITERSVDPRALTAAAVKSARNHGVDFSSGNEVTAVNSSGGRVTGLTTVKTAFHAPKIVNCAGAWSGQIAPHTFPTRPVKGQMLCLIMPQKNLLKHVIRSPEVYLIPRSDGRLLVGTTVEEAGFDKRTSLPALQRLHRAAIKLVPDLANAKILEDWAGLRPGTPDGLPILGATDTPGYYVATGHFRDGILLSAITARVMADVIAGTSPACDLGAFSPSRFQAPPTNAGKPAS